MRRCEMNRGRTREEQGQNTRGAGEEHVRLGGCEKRKGERRRQGWVAECGRRNLTERDGVNENERKSEGNVSREVFSE